LSLKKNHHLSDIKENRNLYRKISFRQLIKEKKNQHQYVNCCSCFKWDNKKKTKKESGVYSLKKCTNYVLVNR
jgi:hypothetical protein